MIKKSISIIIPIYNESENIFNLINEIKISLKDNFLFEIILIDDCSTDKTLEIFNETEFDIDIKLFSNKINSGQSFSIKKGVDNSNFDTIVTLDGDGQNNPNDMTLLLTKYFSDNEICLVGGIRKKRMDSLIKKYSSFFANIIRKFILNDDCNDTGCSLKVFDKNVFIQFPFFSGMHRFFPALFKVYGKKTHFMFVDHRSRIYGKSKYGTLSRLFAGIRDMVKVIIIINKKNND